MTTRRRTNCDRKGPYLDPDPVSVFLAALGAVGSVASIWSVVMYHMDRRQEERRRAAARKRIADAFRDLEGRVDSLRTEVDRMSSLVDRAIHDDRLVDNGAMNSSSSSRGRLRFRFGSVLILFDSYEFRSYTDLHETILTRSIELHRSVAVTIAELDVATSEWKESPLHELNSLRDTLNDVVFSDKRHNGFRNVMQETHSLLTELRRILRHTQDWCEGENM